MAGYKIVLADQHRMFLEGIKTFLENNSTEAIIIRTLYNVNEKQTKNYSNTNPAFIDEEAMKYIVEKESTMFC